MFRKEFDNKLNSSCYLLLLSLLTLFLSVPASFAEEPVLSKENQLDNEINNLSDQILIKDLEILRLGLELKRRGESKKIGRDRRFNCYALANSSLTSVGAFIAGIGRLKYANRPEDAPAELFENATIVRVIANSVSAGGVVVEVAKDTYDALVDRRRKLNLSSIEKQAEKLQNEINELADRRLGLIREIEEPGAKGLFEREQIVLNDVHEAVLDELAAFYSETQANRASRIVQLGSTGISNTVSGLGSIYSGIFVPRKYRDDPVKQVRYGGVGGITDVSTGSLNAATPLLAFGANIAKRRSAKAVLYKQLGAHDIKNLLDLKEHEYNLTATANAASVQMKKGLHLRRKAVAEVMKVLENHRAISERERRKIAGKLIMNTLDSGVDASGSFSKIVNGIGTMVGAYRYTYDDQKRFQVTGGAGLVYGIGNAIGVEEVVRDIITREVRHSRKKKSHQLLTQVMDAEITAVRNVQKELTGNKAN